MNVECTLCHSTTSTVRPFAFGSELTELRRCNGCGCEFLYPQPSNAVLARQYANYYCRRRTAVARPKVAFFDRMLDLVRLELSGRRILEIGSGEGDCIAAINRRWPTASVTAVESNPECLGHYGDLRAELLNVGVDSWLHTDDRREFDVVLLFDLIEHLRDPVSAIRAIVCRHLARGGRIVATFPNSESFSRKAFNVFWPQYKLEHLFYFSRNSVERVARESGLRTVRLEPLAKRLPVEYLLAIGSGFGPASVQWVSRAMSRMAPVALARLSVTIRLGEWLWVAQKG